MLTGAAQDAGCGKSQFEAAVDEAAAALRDLNHKNKPLFQKKLRVLQEKRGWDHDVFLKEAVPFVSDPEIEIYDRKSGDLLDRISAMGQEGSEAKTPDCAMLGELRGYMRDLIAAQTAKWAYMFGKIEMELKK